MKDSFNKICFFSDGNFSKVSETVCPPPKTKMTMENPTIWRCISYWKWWIFHCHVGFGEVTLRSKLCLESPFVFLCSLKAGSFDKVKVFYRSKAQEVQGFQERSKSSSLDHKQILQPCWELQILLVVGFNPFETYATVKLDHETPSFGVKTKNM